MMIDRELLPVLFAQFLQERLAEQTQEMEATQREQRAQMERHLSEVSLEDGEEERARLETALKLQRDRFQVGVFSKFTSTKLIY